MREWVDLSMMARAGSVDKIEALLRSRQAKPEDCNFAFQAACEAGQIEAARALLAASSIISVSRGMRKAAWAGSVECMELALSRMDAEGHKDGFDMALALRDAPVTKPGGAHCVAVLMARARPEESAWALREHLGAGNWRVAATLLRAGAAWEAHPAHEMLSGGIRPRDAGMAPREYWASSLAQIKRSSWTGEESEGPGQRRALEDAVGRRELEEAIGLVESGSLPPWSPPEPRKPLRM